MIGTRNRILMVALATAGMTMGYATPAAAQATRTWVSGVGDDVNPCSRTAPCKTFAGAISKTAAGGEINCLDPGGFGAVTIIKSMTISCPYTEGGALAGGNGIVVNLPLATDVVVLRGLDIFGVNPPSNGVRFIAQGSLHIEDSVIRRFNAANSFGVSFQPSGAGNLYIKNTTITQNGNGATGGGVLIKPTGTGTARAVIEDTQIRNNASTGLFTDTTTNTGGISITVNRTQVSGTTGNGILAVSPAGNAASTWMLANSTVAYNTAIGVGANGLVTMRVGNTTITGNAITAGTGVVMSNGAQILTYLDNRLDGNPLGDGAFVPGSIPKK
ncbi:MAG TPA: right-handed parallel beta-helix repeat-containing protein [Allosphingosinicella sp.]|nr:right-handed parallel beta-helix repeat-containing protein [Allosphingosinicella sp.]